MNNKPDHKVHLKVFEDGTEVATVEMLKNKKPSSPEEENKDEE